MQENTNIDDLFMMSFATNSELNDGACQISKNSFSGFSKRKIKRTYNNSVIDVVNSQRLSCYLAEYKHKCSNYRNKIFVVISLVQRRHADKLGVKSIIFLIKII